MNIGRVFYCELHALPNFVERKVDIFSTPDITIFVAILLPLSFYNLYYITTLNSGDHIFMYLYIDKSWF